MSKKFSINNYKKNKWKKGIFYFEMVFFISILLLDFICGYNYADRGEYRFKTI